MVDVEDKIFQTGLLLGIKLGKANPNIADNSILTTFNKNIKDKYLDKINHLLLEDNYDKEVL